MTGDSVTAALDHVVVVVPDLDRAAADFARAGFTVTPRTDHSAEMGTANRCVMLASTYIELLTVLRPTERNGGWRDLLATGPGACGLALRSDDIAATQARLTRQRISAGPVLSFTRAVAEGTLSFSVVRIDRQATPGLQTLVCQHHTPELLWQPRWCAHGNTAGDIVHLSVSSPDPQTTVDTIRAVDAEDTTAGGGTRTARTAIAVGDTGAPGRIGIRVADPDAVRQAAARDDGPEIDMRASCGVLLELVAE